MLFNYPLQEGCQLYTIVDDQGERIEGFIVKENENELFDIYHGEFLVAAAISEEELDKVLKNKGLQIYCPVKENLYLPEEGIPMKDEENIPDIIIDLERELYQVICPNCCQRISLGNFLTNQAETEEMPKQAEAEEMPKPIYEVSDDC